MGRVWQKNRASCRTKLDDALGLPFTSVPKTPIGCTPYKLIYGKHVLCPIELVTQKLTGLLKNANFDIKTAGDQSKVLSPMILSELQHYLEVINHCYDFPDHPNLHKDNLNAGKGYWVKLVNLNKRFDGGTPCFSCISVSRRMSWIFEASRARGICPSITRASQSSASFGNPDILILSTNVYL
ncbi:hypothetical protein Tco_1337989 [Tanacetum coccineum]